MSYPANLPGILIVDDDADQLFLSRRMLEKAGIKNPIVEVCGGREAIEYLDGCCATDTSAEIRMPALVFLDLKMPMLDGFDVLSWIRGNPALHTLKVIVLTSSDNPNDVKRCTRLGAQGSLLKHPSPIVIASVVREALEEKHAAVTISHDSP